MKSNREVRAERFLCEILPYISNMNDVDEIECGVINYLNDHPNRKVQFFHGAVRAVLVTSDYAIKWDYDAEDAKNFGGCAEEFSMWQEVENSGYEHLFAEVKQICICGIIFNVMPKIGRIGYHRLSIFDYLTPEEGDWIRFNITDLHDYNWGISHKKPVIIDYAMNMFLK